MPVIVLTLCTSHSTLKIDRLCVVNCKLTRKMGTEQALFGDPSSTQRLDLPASKCRISAMLLLDGCVHVNHSAGQTMPLPGPTLFPFLCVGNSRLICLIFFFVNVYKISVSFAANKQFTFTSQFMHGPEFTRRSWNFQLQSFEQKRHS